MPAPIRIFFDGACPLCKREVAYLVRLDRGRGLIAPEDIAAPGFEPGRWGLTTPAVHAAIHAAMPDGRIISGLEVFRRVYAALSPALGALWAVTGWPVLRTGFDAGYRWFARHRVRIGGWFGRSACAGGACSGGRVGGSSVESG